MVKRKDLKGRSQSAFSIPDLRVIFLSILRARSLHSQEAQEA